MHPGTRSWPPAAVERFGRVDVLVNNAANFWAGYFEDLTPAQIERQLSTSLIGPMNVTRAVLPVMRKQRAGHIISISSSAGLIGFEFCTAYSASKFGLEGWMEALQAEVAPFGIRTTIVNPGFFGTELLSAESTQYAEASIADYAERTAAQQESASPLRSLPISCCRQKSSCEFAFRLGDSSGRGALGGGQPRTSRGFQRARAGRIRLS